MQTGFLPSYGPFRRKCRVLSGTLDSRPFRDPGTKELPKQNLRNSSTLSCTLQQDQIGAGVQAYCYEHPSIPAVHHRCTVPGCKVRCALSLGLRPGVWMSR